MKNVKKKRWQLILGTFLILVGISGLSDDFLLAVAIIIFGIYILYRVFSKEKEVPTTEKKDAPLQYSVENEKNQKTLKSVERKKYDYIKARKLVNDITVLDFETTGFSPVENEIIQIGAIKYRNELEVGRFSCYVKPLNPIPPKITKITGITNKMVAEAPFIENVLDDLKQFLENETIVAHNASFDMKFLLENFDRHGIDYKRYRVIDTLSLARQQISETPNHKLPTLKKFLNIEAESHDALADCEVTAKLYYYCKQAQE